jgi:hypothetical protein
MDVASAPNRHCPVAQQRRQFQPIVALLICCQLPKPSMPVGVPIFLKEIDAVLREASNVDASAFAIINPLGRQRQRLQRASTSIASCSVIRPRSRDRVVSYVVWAMSPASFALVILSRVHRLPFSIPPSRSRDPHLQYGLTLPSPSRTTADRARGRRMQCADDGAVAQDLCEISRGL